MLRRRILLALGLALLTAAPALCALTATPTAADFGPVDYAGAPYSLTVTVTNADSVNNAVVESVAVIDAGGAGEFALIAVTDALGGPVSLPFILLPGASFNVEFRFTPSMNLPGQSYLGGAMVAYDTAEVLAIDLKGSVAHTGTLTATPAAADFGYVPAGTLSNPIGIDINNDSTATVTIDSVDIDDGGAGQFRVTTPDLPLVFAPTEKFTFSVVFDAALGVEGTAYTGYVSFFYLFNGEPAWITVDLSASVGTGGGDGETEPGLEESEEGLFIGPCFLGVLPL